MKHIFSVLFAVVALALVGCEEPDNGYGTTPNTTIPSLGTPADNEIWFTTIDNFNLMALNDEAFDATITDIEYSEFGINVIRFDKTLTTIGEKAFFNCRNINNISLPTMVTTIGDSAFAECIQLECMTIGDKITYCGAKAFDNCISLYSLHIPSIGDWCRIEFADTFANPLYHCGAFVLNNKKVKDVVIPKWIKEIKPYAFYNYSQMSSIKFPKSIETIGVDAFAGCEGLSKVDVEDIGAWCKIVFDGETANPLSLAGTLYINGQKATTLSLEGVSGISSRAFIRCSSIQTVVAEDIIRIYDEAFRGCTSLTKVTLGENTKDIYARAFMGCQELNSVTIRATTPPTLFDTYVFDYNAAGRTFYVPSSAVEAYKNDICWVEYADYIKAIQ
ncbi:MAG: leucine-rich repeat domain-containing protein [Alistipes sp.]|nr:leucine-rich repeat domain-containing protein [Alistipes sp.]